MRRALIEKALLARDLESEVVAEAGMSSERVLLLHAAGEGWSMGSAAAFVGVAAPTLTRLVDRMEGEGLVRRVRSRDDRRVVTLETAS